MAKDPLANGFKAALQRGGPLIGYWCTLDGDAAAEIAAGAGFDWLLIDTEHAPASDQDVLRKLQVAAGYPVWPVVRPSANDRIRIKRLLDVGAQTLLIPYVETVEQAAEAVAATRYPPTGKRGVAGTTRAARYGGVPGYLARADEEICVLVQIESRSGLDNLEAIAAVDGVDGVFVGPADLAANCGLTLPADRAKITALIEDTLRQIAATGKPGGILTVVEAEARRYLEMGAAFVAVGVDAAILARESTALAQAFRPV